MKFLADEDIGLGVVSPLRNLGFDVKSIVELNRGADDRTVLNLANKEGRIVITADKDFGELVFAKRLAHKGVVLLRLKKDSSANKLKLLKNLFEECLNELEGSFTVVTEGKVRIT